MTHNRPHATVATVIEKDGCFLLVKELRDGRMVFNQPAGHIENGESIIEAAVRETLEETGWDIKPIFVLSLVTYHAPNGVTYVRTTLAAEALQHHENAQLDDGIIEAIWYTPDEIRSLGNSLRSPVVLEVIEDYLNGVRYPLDMISDRR